MPHLAHGICNAILYMAFSVWKLPPFRVRFKWESVMYNPIDSKIDFPRMEEKILEFWRERRIFEKSIENRIDAEEFVFYDGPPFATGVPHFGHFVPGTVKDIIPRYKTMTGKRVERRFGWDCHGLPVEYEMEKELGISGRREIEKFGVSEFNEACRSIVLRYAEEWRKIMTRSGRWVDFDHDYRTMNPDYMESIWWVVKSLWEKGLIYRGHYILPTCPRCSTPLSNHELNLGGYKYVHDPAITVSFRDSSDENTWFLAWTTTPWTLISNLGLSVGPDIDYVKVESGGAAYILAKARLGEYFKEEKDFSLLWTKKGFELRDMTYEPIFSNFDGFGAAGAFRIFVGTHVSTEEGTGIVHTAPGFGEDDYEVFKDAGIPIVCPVDAEGRFTAEVPEYEGRFVKDCDKDIISRLRRTGKLFKHDQLLHSYPHCWRCESPLIYKAVVSWFVDIQKIKPVMLASNDKVNWNPNHLKSGRFGKWLENARDWAISRNRYWGNPLPIWECDSCGARECLGGREELYGKITYAEARAHRETGGDLHKHYIDRLNWACVCGGVMRRIPEVLDCWFESGAMPFAQVHYPFENKKWFEEHFPCDFICEGVDQTRGWFYTLMVLGAALFETSAYLNVVVNGLVLAEDGKKMSKNLKNYTDPSEVIDKYGADALRLFLMNSAVVRAGGLRYSDEGVREVLKSVMLPLWNAYSFYVTYANIDGIRPVSVPGNPAALLDRWMISETGLLIDSVAAHLDAYDIQRAIKPVLAFIDMLNNWYIRRSKRRFWRSSEGAAMDVDKREAYATLRAALISLAKVTAPFMPFVTEEIYRNLREKTDPESVHLCDWPELSDYSVDEELGMRMSVTRRAVSLGRALRNNHELKIRQPLRSFHLATRVSAERTALEGMRELLAEELNVKEVLFRDNEEELVEYSAKANFKALGRSLGRDMKAVAAQIEKLDSSRVKDLLDGHALRLEYQRDGVKQLEIDADSVEIRRCEKTGLKVLNEGSLTVALDPTITPELLAEGLARDMIRGIQNLRKDSGFEVTDRISVIVDGPDEIREAATTHYAHICGEILADSIQWLPIPESDPNSAEIQTGGSSVRVCISNKN